MAPEGLFYTKSHEWIKIEGETITLGITQHAVDQLQDLVFVDLNPVGEEIDADESFGVIESVKIAADLNTPFAGEIIEINEALTDSPDPVSQDPYGAGWMTKLKVSDTILSDSLMDTAAYTEFCANEEH